MERLDECKAQLLEITEELDALVTAESNQLNLAERVITLQNAEESSRAPRQAAAARVKAAEDALAQLQSEDRARERLLKQHSLETRQADFHAEQEKNQGVLERISAIEAAANKLQSIEREAVELLKSIARLQTDHDAAVKAVRESEDRQRELEAIAQLFRLNTARPIWPKPSNHSVKSRNGAKRPGKGVKKQSRWRAPCRHFRCLAPQN